MFRTEDAEKKTICKIVLRLEDAEKKTICKIVLHSERETTMLKFSDNEIRKAIDILCDELNRKRIKQNVYIIIVGAASLILKFNLRRATSDIDILERISADHRLFGGLGQLLSRMGFHIVSELMLNLHPDYPERLEHYTQKEQVHVFTLHPYDLAISKIGRGFDKDMEDIVTSDLLSHIDMGKLETLYFEAVGYWIGDERRYEMNWNLFLEDYAKESDRSEPGLSEQTDLSHSALRE